MCVCVPLCRCVCRRARVPVQVWMCVRTAHSVCVQVCVQVWLCVRASLCRCMHVQLCVRAAHSVYLGAGGCA